MIWKRTRTSHRERQDPIQRHLKQNDLDMLEWAAADGEICLKYLDEAGFCCWSPVGYSYWEPRKIKSLRTGVRVAARVLQLSFSDALKTVFTHSIWTAIWA
ncbi:hypothetical protein ACQ4M3_31995 [Leptolyngbya sp. AN03gr2]|uniref:hypothetical protein n=1 Tax=unclassified Leptolyngbya TaxID=2650499 RepID=UPI003D32044E